MPYDGIEITPETRRRILIAALRGEKPDGFEWRYDCWFQATSCGTAGCAIGLAHLIWPDSGLFSVEEGPPNDTILDFFGLTGEQAAACFWTAHPETEMLKDVTPEMVAARLENIPANNH